MARVVVDVIVSDEVLQVTASTPKDATLRMEDRAGMREMLRVDIEAVVILVDLLQVREMVGASRLDTGEIEQEEAEAMIVTRRTMEDMEVVTIEEVTIAIADDSIMIPIVIMVEMDMVTDNPHISEDRLHLLDHLPVVLTAPTEATEVKAAGITMAIQPPHHHHHELILMEDMVVEHLLQALLLEEVAMALTARMVAMAQHQLR